MTASDDDAPEWSADVFERAEIKRGGEVVREASGTLTTPSQSMLERAARAALRAEMDHDPGVWDTQPSEWSVESLNVHGYVKIARAVLMAVRDSSGVDFLVNAPVRCDNIISGYIDAILNETPE